MGRSENLVFKRIIYQYPNFLTGLLMDEIKLNFVENKVFKN